MRPHLFPPHPPVRLPCPGVGGKSRHDEVPPLQPGKEEESDEAPPPSPPDQPVRRFSRGEGGNLGPFPWRLQPRPAPWDAPLPR